MQLELKDLNIRNYNLGVSVKAGQIKGIQAVVGRFVVTITFQYAYLMEFNYISCYSLKTIGVC